MAARLRRWILQRIGAKPVRRQVEGDQRQFAEGANVHGDLQR
jgi:hypothetical protein